MLAVTALLGVGYAYLASRLAGGPMGAIVIGLCGLSITLFAMIVALIPPPGTSDIWIHEAKVGGGSLLLVLPSLFIYWRAKRKA